MAHAAELDLGPEFVETHGPDRSLLNHVLSLKPTGWALEFGVGNGGSLKVIAATMPVIGFDSFQGLPEDWRPKFPAGKFATKPVLHIPGTTVVVGLFADTLPGYDWPDNIGMVHVDCDLYSSTATVLEHVGPHLRTGCYVVFDEFHSYPGCEEHEMRAWFEFVERTGIEYDVVGHGREQWAVRIR